MSRRPKVAALSQTTLLPSSASLIGDDPATRALFDQGNRQIDALLDSATPRVFIISGPSGVGKDSVLDHLREAYPNAQYVITATSRPMRPGEIDGIHYLFLERTYFERRIEEGEFLESALVYGNLYGVPRWPVEEGFKDGRDVIIKIDVQGASTIRKMIPNAVSIFLLPESMEALLTRLRDRKTEDPDVLLKRFRTASEELERANEFDYRVFNQAGKLSEAVEDIHSIIEAEKRRVNQDPIVLPPRAS